MKTEIHEEIRTLMTRKKISQQEMANRIGTHRLAVHRFINGYTDLRIDKFIAMLHELDVKLVYEGEYLADDPTET